MSLSVYGAILIQITTDLLKKNNTTKGEDQRVVTVVFKAALFRYQDSSLILTE